MQIPDPATTATAPPPDQPRGTYGKPERGNKGGAAGILLVLGLTAGVYALSPGAMYFYKHGHLPRAGRQTR